MDINSDYIEQHLARQNAIKLRAKEINNFLSDVDTGYDYREYDWCGVVVDCLDIEIEYGQVILSHDDGDWDQRSWSIPIGLFDMTDEELVEYVEERAREQCALDLSVTEKRLQREAEALGFRLVKKGEE